MVAHMEANPGTAGPVVYKLSPSDEESPPVALHHDSTARPNCPTEVIIEGNGKTVTLTGVGALLNVGRNITLTLRNITLKGITGNWYPLLYVTGGTVRLEDGGIIRDNKNNQTGGGAAVFEGSFYLAGGEIRDNSAGINGGGIAVYGTGSFYMSGGEIRDNSAAGDGGGLWASSTGGVFLTGGAISHNAANQGGGMYIEGMQGTHEISGTAEILRNTAFDAGGVAVARSTILTMSGGSIRDNVCEQIGGGVYLADGATFNMLGGSIANNVVLSLVPLAPPPSIPYGTGVALEDLATFTMDGTAVVAADNTVGGKTTQPVINVGGYLSADPAANIRMWAVVDTPVLTGSNLLIQVDGVYHFRRFLVNGTAGRISSSGTLQ
jgi:hypothetical protein